MSPKKILALIVLLLPVLGACFSSSLVFEEENFPLTQTDNLSAGETIYHLGTSDSALVFDTLNSVQGIDVDKHTVDWKVDGFSANVDSEILFSDNYAVLMSDDAILLIFMLLEVAFGIWKFMISPQIKCFGKPQLAEVELVFIMNHQ